jgi:thiamine biosynthesis lipoprotein
MNQVRRARPLLGTLVQIAAAASLPAVELHAAVTAAFAEIALVHSLMSWHDAGSDLSRINRLAALGPQPLHPHTRAVLAAALEFARLSAGAFDPCVAATLTKWGLLPAAADVPAPDTHASWRDIELDGECVRFHRPLWVDLGGIAKGYAVDLALQCLLRLGVPQCVVNAGGDLRVAGPAAHLVAIRHPLHAHALVHQLALSNEALATSSAFESRYQAPTGSVCALVNPATGSAYQGQDSVSVRAPACMTADALTKVALFAPSAVAESVFEVCGAQCLRLEPAPS